MAFTRLMRLPERLEAERESEGDALPSYLDDPMRFFVPARLMRGTLLILAITLLAHHVEPDFTGGLLLFSSGLILAIGLGQFVPAIVVRTMGPERTLELLLPVFTVFANVIDPLTALIVNFLGTVEGRTPAAQNGAAATTAPVAAAQAAAEAAEESRLLRSVVDFGDTLVREVMTPRPDIVAIRSSSTIDDLRQLVRDQEYSRLPVYAENLDNIVGLVVVKDLIQRAEE